MEHYDLIVLGGGRAANLAIAAAQAGRKVALIERDRLGGTCPNYGCVPSKLLIGFAEAARRVREADRHFITARIEDIDHERIFREVNEWVAGVDGRYESRLPEGVTLHRGHGRFVADKEIEVNGTRISADTIVVATGTRARPVPFAGQGVWTSKDLFPLQGAPPRSITIVGGGFIACELANFFAAIGIETRLLVRGERLLPAEDEDIATVFTEQFSRQVPVSFQTGIRELERDDRGYHLTLEDGEGSLSRHQSERVLFAIGRVATTDDLGLEHTGLRTDARGFLEVDDHLRTSVPGVYAAGDIAGRHILQHVASYDIHYLRRCLLKGETGPIDYGMVPHAVFSDPEVAGVGATERELKEKGVPHVAVTEDWLASARAMASRLSYPRTKLLVSPEDYRILGCHLVGPEASTMLHEILPLLRVKNDVRLVTETMHIHPALPEALLAVAVSAVKAVREFRAREA